MPKCSYCGSTILMGGVRAGDQRFCNKKCHQNAYVLSVTKNIPPEVLEQKIEELWHGTCPQCGGAGPIEVHKVYQVWSALVTTRWKTKSQVSCRSCAVKRQLAGTIFSLLFGWWGLPWGLILTPVQIGRNIAAMGRGPDSSRASDALRKSVLVKLATQRMAQQKAAAPPPVISK